eukprot:2701539-Prymnesium_polylepis.1
MRRISGRDDIVGLRVGARKVNGVFQARFFPEQVCGIFAKNGLPSVHHARPPCLAVQSVSIGGAATGAAPAPASRVRRVRKVYSNALRRVLRCLLLQQVLSVE